MGYDNGLKQHTNMAMGDGVMDSGNFGVKPFDHSKGPNMTPISEGMKSHTEDGSKRGAMPPVPGGAGKHPRQANPDHGHHGKLVK